MTTRTPAPTAEQEMAENASSSAAMTGKAKSGIKPASSAATNKQTVVMQNTPANKSKWSQQVKAAKSQWSKMSEAELLKVDGDPQQLASLIEKHYSLSPEVAKHQAKNFMQRQPA